MSDMGNIKTLKVDVLKKVQRARDKIAEEVAEEYVHDFFVQDVTQEFVKGDTRTIVSLAAINPKKNLMKDFRALFVRTEVRGWIEGYRAALVKLTSTILELKSTPDLALILQVIVMKRGSLVDDNCRFEIGLVEVKRGKAVLSTEQRKDVKVAETRGIPYYLLRVDDSDCLNGRIVLTLKLLTPELSLSIPESAQERQGFAQDCVS